MAWYGMSERAFVYWSASPRRSRMSARLVIWSRDWGDRYCKWMVPKIWPRRSLDWSPSRRHIDIGHKIVCPSVIVIHARLNHPTDETSVIYWPHLRKQCQYTSVPFFVIKNRILNQGGTKIGTLRQFRKRLAGQHLNWILNKIFQGHWIACRKQLYNIQYFRGIASHASCSDL